MEAFGDLNNCWFWSAKLRPPKAAPGSVAKVMRGRHAFQGKSSHDLWSMIQDVAGRPWLQQVNMSEPFLSGSIATESSCLETITRTNSLSNSLSGQLLPKLDPSTGPVTPDVPRSISPPWKRSSKLPRSMTSSWDSRPRSHGETDGRSELDRGSRLLRLHDTNIPPSFPTWQILVHIGAPIFQIALEV